MNESLILAQLTSSAVVVYLLQLLKNSKWFPWLTAESVKLNRFASAVAAALVGIGVHASFDHASGTLLVTGLTVTNILHGIWHWANSFALQETIYQATKKQPVVVNETRPQQPTP